MNELVVAEGLGFSARGSHTPILADVSLSLGAGETVVCTGPSGSGKTTLGIHLAGFHDVALEGVTTGGLRLGGQDATRGGRRGFAGLVLQNPSAQLFYPTVNEELAAVRAQLPRSKVRVEHWVEQLDLQRLIGRRVEALSLGEKQLLGVGLMLLAEPRLLVLDEPTSYLDEHHASVLIAALTTAAREGTTVVVIEPSLRTCPELPPRDALLEWARRVVRLERGRVTYDGPPHNLRTDSLIQRPRLPVQVGVPKLVVEGLSFGYEGAHDVLSDVSLTVGAGEIVVLRGANASGKTTLLELMQGLHVPRRGRIALPTVTSGRGRRAALPAALVLQSPDDQLFATSAGDECGVGLTWTGVPRPERRSRVARALLALGLDALEARVPFTLSFGEKRRLTVASALVLQPDLLLLDEPSVGLDPASVQLLVGAVAEHALAGGATVIATHDRELERALATRVVTLERGTIARDERHTGSGAAA